MAIIPAKIGKPPAETNNGNDSDGDFEPTAEMMVDDFDDERTMAEEEALEMEGGEDEDELELLRNEQDMPIDKLKEMFGYRGDQVPLQHPVVAAQADGIMGSADVSSSGEETDNDEADVDGESKDTSKDHADGIGGGLEKDSKEGLKDPLVKDKKDASGTHKLLTRASRTAQLLRAGSRETTDDEEDEEFHREQYWRKTIQVGSSYQADIPESLASYDDTLPYENEDTIQWEPGKLDDQTIVDFYDKWNSSANNGGMNGGDPETLPMGGHVRDDERALWLLRQCGFSVDEALRRQKLAGAQGGAGGGFANGDAEMTPWSEEECRAFEAGLRLHGKDFVAIRANKISTRSIKELVNFYYLWKKTERHDVFTSRTRLEKKKYALHPGTTDYMDKFLDEQEALVSRSSSPGEGKMVVAGGKTEAGVAVTAGNVGASSASANNNTIPNTPAVPSPTQPIPTPSQQPVT
ncbi:mesoderm induction early response protein 1-like isoform X2 [Varroa jacobsoni]|uniref:mesoderm induction early response protein 1-like isoform X2 n=1 Tax=Varroa jacobsoni TaxID=62625 RepID=UPI000BF2D0A7|nr:mesoderm induction early response protein 1-like isoform X2 [Varroa jacobsoni]